MPIDKLKMPQKKKKEMGPPSGLDENGFPPLEEAPEEPGVEPASFIPLDPHEINPKLHADMQIVPFGPPEEMASQAAGKVEKAGKSLRSLIQSLRESGVPEAKIGEEASKVRLGGTGKFNGTEYGQHSAEGKELMDYSRKALADKNLEAPTYYKGQGNLRKVTK
jgi:hypothetical protein